MNNFIKTGDAAPTFKVQDIWGNQVSSQQEGKWHFISFHRFASCPFCNLRTNELIRFHKYFEEYNIGIISIWPSSVKNMVQYSEGKKAPFPLISDSNKTLFKKFGVVKSSGLGALKMLLRPNLVFNAIRSKGKLIGIDGDPFMYPASFLIDPFGIVKLAYYGQHYGDHISINEIFSLVNN